MQTDLQLSRQEASTLAKDLIQRVSACVFGQNDLVIETVCAFLAGGHILITGAPGLAKTTLVRKFASLLTLPFSRIQFTPDLMPTDILGAEILNLDPTSGRRALEFVKGPIFASVLLADEVNRASPRTQAAMLEAMQERQITVAGKAYPLPSPFMVCATQNPFESEGTFPLPEAQLDRFLLHSLVSYPKQEAEELILSAFAQGELIDHTPLLTEGVYTPEQVGGLLRVVKKITVPSRIIKLVTALVRATRPEDSSCPAQFKEAIWFGAGPRAGLSLIAASQALALMEGDEAVNWNHIKRLACPALRHRVKLSLASSHDGLGEDQLIQAILLNLDKGIEKLALGME